MRQNITKHAENSLGAVAVVSAVVGTDNNSGSVTAVGKQLVKTDVLNDGGEKEVEYSSSMKIDSSFVADSLAMDALQNRNSDDIVLNQSGSATTVQVKSENTDMNCQLQRSDNDCQLKQTSAPLVDSACVRDREQTSQLGSVTAATPDNNLVSMFLVVLFHCAT